MIGNNLVPELSVSNLKNSLKFYCDILGFKIEFERAEDRFAYLSFHGSELMLEQQFPEPLEPQSSSRFLVWPFVNLHAIMRLKTHSIAPF